MKNCLTSWKLWAGIAVVLAVLLVLRANAFISVLPFAFLLICPIMMMFMMKGHKHK